MVRMLSTVFVLFICQASVLALDGDEAPLTEQLGVFKPLLGKTYRAEFANSTPDKPVIDVARWERALNGQAIRHLHSINGGAYGGETIFMWDAERKTIAYWYFTTAGFRTEGTVVIDGKRWICNEKVKGSAGGVEEVRSTAEVRSDGSLVVTSEHLKNGVWEKGNERTYTAAPDMQVVFK